MTPVSIVIPCYKHGALLPEAIESALAQTWPCREVIVVNDGSPDNTREICRQYGNRIRYLEQENKGLPEARNAGIRIATGNYVLPLDADDKLDPRFLEATVPVLEANPQVGYVYTDVVEFGAANPKESAKYFGTRTWDVVRLLVYNLSVCTALFRKCDWERVGGYCSRFVHGAEDWDFWLSLVELGRIGYYVPEPLFHYRRHPGGGMWSAMVTRAAAESYNLLIQRHRQLFEQHWPELLVEWSRRYQESFAYIRKVEPLLEEYYGQRTGRLERFGIPRPLAQALRRLIPRKQI